MIIRRLMTVISALISIITSLASFQMIGTPVKDRVVEVASTNELRSTGIIMGFIFLTCIMNVVRDLREDYKRMQDEDTK